MNRNLFLFESELCIENVADICETILEISRQDMIVNENVKTSPPKRINLFINSYGGDISAALALIDVMNKSYTPVDTICLGAAESAAFLVFISGEHRFMAENARLMWHDVSTEAVKSADSIGIREHYKMLNELRDNLDAIIQAKTEVPADLLTEIYEKHLDCYFYCGDSLKYNCADFLW